MKMHIYPPRPCCASLFCLTHLHNRSHNNNKLIKHYSYPPFFTLLRYQPHLLLHPSLHCSQPHSSPNLLCYQPNPSLLQSTTPSRHRYQLHPSLHAINHIPAYIAINHTPAPTQYQTNKAPDPTSSLFHSLSFHCYLFSLAIHCLFQTDIASSVVHQLSDTYYSTFYILCRTYSSYS